MKPPSLFVEVISPPDRVKVEYSVERQRDLEVKDMKKKKKKKNNK